MNIKKSIFLLFLTLIITSKAMHAADAKREMQLQATKQAMYLIMSEQYAKKIFNIEYERLSQRQPIKMTPELAILTNVTYDAIDKLDQAYKANPVICSHARRNLRLLHAKPGKLILKKYQTAVAKATNEIKLNNDKQISRAIDNLVKSNGRFFQPYRAPHP